MFEWRIRLDTLFGAGCNVKACIQDCDISASDRRKNFNLMSLRPLCLLPLALWNDGDVNISIVLTAYFDGVAFVQMVTLQCSGSRCS